MGRERREFGSIRKLTSGRHQATYTGPELLRHVAPSTRQTKIDAEGWLHEERKLIEANEWSPPKHRAEKARAASTTPDLETYAKKWIARRRTDKGEPLRASTRANYEATLEHHLVPTFGRMRLRDISKGAVRRWYEDTLEGNGDTPRANSKAYGLLRAIMNSAVDEDLIGASPVHIRGAGYQPKRRRLEPASIEELDVIVDNMPEKWKLMIVLASWCALRYGEIAELRRKDIKLRHVSGRWTGVIQVRRGVVWVNRKDPGRATQVGGWHPRRGDPAPPDPDHQGAPGDLRRTRPGGPALSRRQRTPAVAVHHHQLLQEGSHDRRTLRSPLPRPAPHRRGDGCAARRHAR